MPSLWALELSFHFNNPFPTFLEASSWVKSGDRERSKTNPCLQGAHSLVGEETSEQVLKRQGGEGIGILRTQDRPLVLLPLAGTRGGDQRNLCLPCPPPPSPRNRSSWKAQGGRRKEKFGLKRKENETEQRSLFQFDNFF